MRLSESEMRRISWGMWFTPFVLFLLTVGTATAAWGENKSAGRSADNARMVKIPQRRFRPLFRDPRETSAGVAVESFSVDILPVTRGEFARFVSEHPEWRRSRRKSLFADEKYLAHWSDDTTPPPPIAAPVTEISWFAARAYCRSLGKRLPSSAEWELVASASESAEDASGDSKSQDKILAWYSHKSPYESLPPVGQHKNFWGVYDLHGLVWEWVNDFNGELTTGESRGDTDADRNLFCGAGSLNATEKDRVNYAAFMRYALRGSLQGTYTLQNLGFRCVAK